MRDELRRYLGVLPFDYAQSREFNVYDWARRNAARKYLEEIESVPPPNYFLDGKPVTPDDIKHYIALCTREVDEVINNSRGGGI